MEGLTLHDGGAVHFDVVLPQAPWDPPEATGGARLTDGAIEALVAQTGSAEPGPWLAGVLDALAAPDSDGGGDSSEGIDRDSALDRLDAVELAGAVAAAERLAGWARAIQARAGAALVAAQGGILGLDQAATVVKDRLHVTAREGTVIVNRGDRCARFPSVLSALEAGRIDARKADTLLGAGAELTDKERSAAIEVLLPEAPTRTWKWLSEQLNALATRLHGTTDELTEAAAERNVWLETAGPGMALLTALLPAKDGARVFNAVQTGAAQLMNQPGQTRRRGQARADALTSLVTGRMVPHPIEEVEETEETGTTSGRSGEHSLAQGASGEDNEVTDTRESVVVPTIPPGTLVAPVRDTDLVPVPTEDDDVLSTAPAPTQAEVEAGVVVRGIEAPATINVTVPASVLADPGQDTPGILDLLGPIPAELAREIASEGIWHRLVTDPVTGVLTDYSTTAYQPPPRLRRAVQVRDRVCTHTGCDRPAARCDLDHVDPFDPEHEYAWGEPGQTRATNLHALCRRHHNLKTLAGWDLERDPTTGTETWTSPTGHVQTYRPDPADPQIRYAGTAGVEAEPFLDPPRDLTLARPPRTPGAASGLPPTPPTDRKPPDHSGDNDRPPF